MPVEILILAWGCVLMVAQVFLAAHLKTRELGTDWNIGPRDEPTPPLGRVAGRARRAQDNLAETFPIAIAALLGVVLAQRTGTLTAVGGWLWLAMRVLYVPIYLAGVRGLRTAVFLVSLVGLALVLWPLLIP